MKGEAAVLFARVSSLDQADKYSLPDQKQRGIVYAAAHGLRIVKEVVVQESGYKKEREHFSEMVRFIKDQRIKHLLTLNEDRLTRHSRFVPVILELLEDYDMKVHWTESPGRPLDKHDKDGIMRLEILVAVAERFVRHLVDETKRGILEKQRQGLFHGKAPIGYSLDLKHRLVIDEKYVPLVKFVFEEYGKGGQSLAVLEKKVFDQGWRSRPTKNRPAGRIDRSVIGHMLKNEAYIGRVNGQPGIHPALISEELFSKVQEIMKEETHPRPLKSIPFFFKRRIRCGLCGRYYHWQKVECNSKVYVYGDCRKPGCENPSIKQEFAIERMFDIYRDFRRLKIKNFDVIRQALKQQAKTEEESTKEEIEKVQKEIEREQGRLDLIYSDRLDSKIDKATCEKAMSEVQKRISQLKSRLESLSRENSEVKKEGLQLLDTTESLVEYLREKTALTKDEYRNLFDELVSHGIVKDKRIAWVFREPFQTLFKQCLKGDQYSVDKG